MNKEDFIQLLVSHDWSYQYSDDPNAYKRGQAQRDAIKEAMNDLGELGVQLYNAYDKTPKTDPVKPTKKPAQVQRKVVCRNSGKVGNVFDKTPNGFLEVSFDGEYGIKYVRQSDVIKLY